MPTLDDDFRRGGSLPGELPERDMRIAIGRNIVIDSLWLIAGIEVKVSASYS